MVSELMKLGVFGFGTDESGLSGLASPDRSSQARMSLTIVQGARTNSHEHDASAPFRVYVFRNRDFSRS
jgi:hypothetical protein